MNPVPMSIAPELDQLLHPLDPRDMPTPGFATGDAVIAWARQRRQHSHEIDSALLDVLRTEDVPQQSMAAAVLRAFGYEVAGYRGEESFLWTVEGHGINEQITAAVSPPPPISGA